MVVAREAEAALAAAEEAAAAAAAAAVASPASRTATTASGLGGVNGGYGDVEGEGDDRMDGRSSLTAVEHAVQAHAKAHDLMAAKRRANSDPGALTGLMANNAAMAAVLAPSLPPAPTPLQLMREASGASGASGAGSAGAGVVRSGSGSVSTVGSVSVSVSDDSDKPVGGDGAADSAVDGRDVEVVVREVIVGLVEQVLGTVEAAGAETTTPAVAPQQTLRASLVQCKIATDASATTPTPPTTTTTTTTAAVVNLNGAAAAGHYTASNGGANGMAHHKQNGRSHATAVDALFAGAAVGVGAPAPTPAAGVVAMPSSLPDDLLLWDNTEMARAYSARGWYRSESHWRRSVDCGGGGSGGGKNYAPGELPSVLVKCATDLKYRSRLCNHWDSSKGTYCPIKKKGRCDFAHGPVELRVTERKRNRWGTSVDECGECLKSNLRASGGEDTYGAARNIEHMRRADGKDASQKLKQQGNRQRRDGRGRKGRGGGGGGRGGGGGGGGGGS